MPINTCVHDVLRLRLASFEPLERRAYLNGASFASLSGTGTLHVVGDAADNDIAVTFTNDGMANVVCDGDTLSFDATQVRRIKVDAGDGDDRVTILAPRRATLVGGAGNDTLIGGRENDSLDGGAGDDVLDGGAGSDGLYGGDGFDVADYSSRSTAFSFEIETRYDEDEEGPITPTTEDAGFATASADIGDETDFLGLFIERINGTELNDSYGIAPFGFDDRTLDGGGGNDSFSGTIRQPTLLIGGEGDDTFELLNFEDRATVLGGAGDDTIIIRDDLGNLPESVDGGDGNDRMDLAEFYDQIRPLAFVDMAAFTSVEEVFNIGQAGPVRVIGNAEDNLLNASTARFPVTLLGGGGNDTLIGGARDDILNGDAGDDLIAGAGGDDNLHGGTGNDTLGGGSGRDRLYGESGNDLLAGHAGNDRLYGGAGIDTFVGGSGNDTLFARDGLAEALYGGSGVDKAQIDDDTDVTFSIEALLT